MTQCPQCLNEIENARACNVCGMTNNNYKRISEEEYQDRRLERIMRDPMACSGHTHLGIIDHHNEARIPMSGGGFFNGVAGVGASGGFFNGVPASGEFFHIPSTYTTVADQVKMMKEMDKKESIFSKIKTLYHKFD